MYKQDIEAEFTGDEIAIIGMAGEFPGARNISEFWENLKNGIESITFLTDQELKEISIEPEIKEDPGYVSTKGGELADQDYFDASSFC